MAVTIEEFVVVWQSAASLDDVARATGLSRSAACARASRLRRHGVALKLLRGYDYDALAKLATEAGAGE